jgi:hypothetical protein
MALEIVDAHPTENGLAVTFVTDAGLVPLEGSAEELGRLADVMAQVAALAPLNETEKMWIEEVRGGCSGQARSEAGRRGARPHDPPPAHVSVKRRQHGCGTGRRAGGRDVDPG